VVLVVVIGIVYMVRLRGANDRAENNARPFFVPVIVMPSVQLASGQQLLYKATNVWEETNSFRLMLFNDREGVPTTYKDFPNIRPGTTVSYVYEPPMTQLTVGATKVEAPEAVRAVFAPMPAGDPGAIRRIVANVQVVRVQPAANANALPALDPLTIVPLEHCNFEPRGFVPYSGLQWYWNCAPQMFPIEERWRQTGLSPGERGNASR
jgi:hypothetical protein